MADERRPEDVIIGKMGESRRQTMQRVGRNEAAIYHLTRFHKVVDEIQIMLIRILQSEDADKIPEHIEHEILNVLAYAEYHRGFWRQFEPAYVNLNAVIEKIFKDYPAYGNIERFFALAVCPRGLPRDRIVGWCENCEEENVFKRYCNQWQRRNDYVW